MLFYIFCFLWPVSETVLVGTIEYERHIERERATAIPRKIVEKMSIAQSMDKCVRAANKTKQIGRPEIEIAETQSQTASKIIGHTIHFKNKKKKYK